MKRFAIITLAAIIFVYNAASAQKLAAIEVDVHASYTDIPVQINLDEITFLHEDSLSLYEVTNGIKTQVPFQINDGDFRTLNWLVSNPDSQKRHVFDLMKQENKEKFEALSYKTEGGRIILMDGHRNLIAYQFESKYPPEGIDSSYKRSGFIHPLWAPHGQILTQIQPEDHYHHYGIWNPWTHVLFEGDTLDFWNLAKKEGTVKFENFISLSEGPVYSEYQALQQHIVFKESGIKKIALNELQTVRLYKPSGNDYYIADLIIELNCAGESPFKILEYRYAGLGWRATEKWNKDNSEILTSENKTRKDADGSRARWCMVQGKFDEDYAGIILMSYPANYNFKEPLRVWPETQNGRGDVFVNFSPTKNTDWLLEPGRKYVLKYRLLVFNGHFTKENAESAWQNFAGAVKIKVNKY